MSRPVAWGLLSTARINEAVLAGARASDRVDVVAVASRDVELAAAYAADRGIPCSHGSYEALLADPEVEAVYIPLPNSLHVEWTLRALAAGKHVLVEKPFSRRAEEVERAFDAAEESGLVLSEGFMWRHHPQTQRLVELVDGGAIGRLRLVRAAFGFKLADSRGPEDTRFAPALDGGALMDVGCYCLSGLRLFAGEPARIHAEQVVGDSGVDVCVAASLGFANGIVGHFDCGFVLPFRDELEIVGEEGTLFVDDPWHIREPGIELRRGGGVERIEVPQADSYRLELENVSDAIRGRAPLLLGRADAVGQARGLEELYRSAEAVTTIDWSAR